MSSAFLLGADAIVAVHLGFVLFVLLGGLLVLRWPRVAFLHLPSVIWGIAVEYAGWVCPLTPVEGYLRERGGTAAYSGDFVEHYILPILYPASLTRDTQALMGSLALAVNGLVYWRVIRARRAGRVKAATRRAPPA
jgi:hypothetical protein